MIATITPKMPSAEPKISTISTLRREEGRGERGGDQVRSARRSALRRGASRRRDALNKEARVLRVRERAAASGDADADAAADVREPDAEAAPEHRVGREARDAQVALKGARFCGQTGAREMERERERERERESERERE
jgi:hypothetical protein